MITRSLMAVLLGLTAMSAVAQRADPVADGVRRCARQSEERQRLACYDALAKALPGIEVDQFGMTADIARNRPASPEPAPAAPAPAPASGRHEASVAPHPPPPISRAAAREGPTSPDEGSGLHSGMLLGKIAALRSGARGVLIFTLDNRQVWTQVEPQPSVRYEVGEAVHIEHGALGSLWLAADKGRKTKVKRIS